MPNQFGKRGLGVSNPPGSQALKSYRVDELPPEMPSGTRQSTGAFPLLGAMAGGGLLVLAASLLTVHQLSGHPPQTAEPVATVATLVDKDAVEDEDLEEMLRQQRAERERMDREEAEREQQRQEEDERWQRAQDERARRDAEAARHAEQMELERKKQAKLDQQHQELLEQNAKIERQRAQAERQRRKADERRHQEQLAEEKRSQKAIRDSNRPRGASGGIIRSEPTQRMLGDGPGLFERD